MTFPLFGKMIGSVNPTIEEIPQVDDVILEISPELVQLLLFVFCAWASLILLEVDVIRRKLASGFGMTNESVSIQNPVQSDNKGWVSESTFNAPMKAKV
eukprot:CAMPEP_0194129100 /NCGR_PEP_ID=MMETSP0152-20130528/310_1 /TAXON_ID=1049557 /ORGANISM="Thalassiothrix antarctica, Strain L6-D1" /LENGTH=98 /DNA_ID=CAMNT_0038823181 /DNA_START=8 /DNA_END=300 /DNA_ORIENTATION=-